MSSGNETQRKKSLGRDLLKLFLMAVTFAAFIFLVKNI